LAKAAAMTKAGITNTTDEANTSAEKEAVNAEQTSNIKKMLPYIIGVAVLGIVIYFIVKR
jgi:hypothetical protein